MESSDPSAPGVPPPAARRRSRWVRIATWVLPVVLVAALAYSLHSQYASVRADLANLSLWSVLAAVALSTAGVGTSMLSWRALLADLGSRLPLKAAVRVYSFSQLGKYVPGSVWPVLAQMELGRAYGVPRVRAATTFLLTVLVSVVTAVATGGLLALSTPGWGRLLALLPLVLVLLHPRLLRPLIGLAARVMRRPGAAEPPTLSGVSRGAGWSVGLWLLLGAACAVLAHGLGADVSYLRVVAAVALAWAAGLVIVFAPAGAGVRESVLALLLAGQIGSGRAVALALLSRLAMSAADGIWALVAVAARHRGTAGDADAAGTAESDQPGRRATVM